MFYLDDGTLGGSLEDVTSDLQYLADNARHIGLMLNCSKLECICKDDTSRNGIMLEFLSLHDAPYEKATLLDSLICEIEAINTIAF